MSATATRQPFERSFGRAEIGVKAGAAARPGGSVLAHLLEDGCARIRLPRSRTPDLEAITINTAGGLTGGDRIELAVEVGPDASLSLTTQAAEKIYRAAGDEPAMIDCEARVGPGGRLAWLPQETILFDRARLARRTRLDLQGSSRLIALEAVILGRHARGETVRHGFLSDRVEVTLDGRRVWLDPLRLEGEIARIAALPSVLDGAASFATVLLCGPPGEAMVEPARAILARARSHAALSFREPVMACRLIGRDAALLRADLAGLLPALATLVMERPVTLPRVWLS